jgi:hypothetical protein
VAAGGSNLAGAIVSGTDSAQAVRPAQPAGGRDLVSQWRDCGTALWQQQCVALYPYTCVSNFLLDRLLFTPDMFKTN